MLDEIYVAAPTSNYSPNQYNKIGFILHWMAGYLPGTDAMFQRTSTGYATNYGIGSKDGKGNGLEVHRYTPTDRHRAFGSYNDDADNRGISIEIENDYYKAYPGKPTAAVHELVAQFMAEKAVKFDMRINGKLQLVLGDYPDHRNYLEDIPAFGRDYNVTTHRSMALKDCPGTTDVKWLVARANEIIQELTGEKMPTIFDRKYSDPTPSTVPADGKWHEIYLSETARSVIVDEAILNGVATIYLKGLPLGSEPVQVRPIVLTDSTQARKSYGAEEIHGSDGTVSHKIPFVISQKDGQRLRFEITSPVAGVVVTALSITALKW